MSRRWRPVISAYQAAWFRRLLAGATEVLADGGPQAGALELRRDGLRLSGGGCRLTWPDRRAPRERRGEV